MLRFVEARNSSMGISIAARLSQIPCGGPRDVGLQQSLGEYSECYLADARRSNA